MAFILHHAKLQLPSSTLVNVTAEAWGSAREGSLSCCVPQPPPLMSGGNFAEKSRQNTWYLLDLDYHIAPN